MAHLHQHYDPYYQLQQPPAEVNGINTLFVSGLPDDVKPREIHNLFRRRHGFESCQLKYTGRGNQVVAFATFFNHQSAMAALHSLNGVKFDPQTGSTLHIELARSNSRRKHKPGSGAYVVIDKRTQTTRNAKETSSGDGGSDSDEALAVDNADSTRPRKFNIYKKVAHTLKGIFEPPADPDSALAIASQDQPENTVGGPHACSTLFIANLGPNCTEDELRRSLGNYPGFNVLKLRAKGGMPVAFADFEEIEQAKKVMEELQGSLLASSDRGGMHIEFARSKMRKP